MSRQLYTCAHSLFSSYLCGQLASFVEYKVNVGGCVPESFLPVLRRFDRYCTLHPQDHACLKPETFLGFMDEQKVKNSTAKRTEGVIRSFCRYLILVLGIDACEVFVPVKLIKRTGKTFVPYVFSKDEAAALMEASESYKPKCRNKPTHNLLNSVRCMIKMLYCTGMRVSEASDLLASEVDIENRVIYINHAKNDNRRIVTMSASLAEACLQYIRQSEGLRTQGVYFFDSESSIYNGRVTRGNVYNYFRRFLILAGIEHKGTGFGPRLLDLRVTFAVHALQQLDSRAIDINACLYYLSVYMGHSSLHETQEYLWLTGESFRPLLDRMEAYTAFVSDIFNEKAGDPDYE